MKSEDFFSIHPLRMIRVAKNISANDMANYFEITPSYLFCVEKGKRTMRPSTLKYGLINLNITYEDYIELDEFSNELMEKEMSNYDKYKYMLMKTLGILIPEEKNEVDQILSNVLTSRVK